MLTHYCTKKGEYVEVGGVTVEYVIITPIKKLAAFNGTKDSWKSDSLLELSSSLSSWPLMAPLNPCLLSFKLQTKETTLERAAFPFDC